MRFSPHTAPRSILLKGSFSSFESLRPSCTPSRRLTKTNWVTFSCSNWTLSIYDMIKGEDCSFTKHMQIKSRLIIRRNLSRYQSPCPSFFENQKDPFRVSISSFWIWALLSSTYFFGFILYLFHFDFSLFLYPYPLGTAFASIENLFLCMNLYYSIPISSRHFPRKIPNWIQNWRVNVSLSMRLGTLQIGIHFLTGFRALVSRPRSFRWPMLCWRDIYMIRSIA